MKTLVVRIKDEPANGGWPVELCVDDGTRNWHAQSVATGVVPANAPPLALSEGDWLHVDQIVPFLLDNPVAKTYLDIGRYLFGMLRGSGVSDKWDELRTAHAAPNGEGLRTVFEVFPPALVGLPWEALMDGDQAVFLDPQNPYVRGPVDYTRTIQPYLVPLRLMVVVGDPQDSRLAWEQELEAIRDEIPGFAGRIDVEYMLGPTPTQFITEHGEFQPHVVHFVGHGISSPSGVGAALVFNNGEAGKRELIAPDIVSRLRTGNGRLAVLNACRTEQAPNPKERQVLNRQSWSLADAFRKAGYYSVVGMQADVPAQASVAFTRALYRGLAASADVDVAVAEARNQIGDNRPDVRVPALLLRDWILPSLIVSVPPERVLARCYGVGSDVAAQIESSDEFGEIAAFVDRTRLRRDVYSQLEKDNPPEHKELLVVHGSEAMGKTWLVRHALRTCAWRGRRVYYVSFEGMHNLRLPEALRVIRDGSGTYISPGLARLSPVAAHRLNHDLCYLCRGRRPPPFDEGAPPPGAGGCAAWEPGELIDAVFESLLQALVTAAQRAPLILALDQLENVEPSALRQLADYFLRPVARGRATPLRVIVALRTAQLSDRWWPPDLSTMRRVTVVPLEGIEEAFEPLALEFFRHQRVYDMATVKRVIGGYGGGPPGSRWPPSLLETIKESLDKVPWAKVPGTA